jgi:tRNA-specific 2-thiouridylase
MPASNKDQSYFLHAVSASALADTVFPLGDLQKPDVRRIARDHGLAPFDKKDSTGICFIGERPFREFLATYLPARPGPIRSAEGELLGEHQGLMYYTPGQRQGLGIGGRRNAGDEPWYVARKDLDTNTLTVVQGEHPMLYSESIIATDPAWIGAPPSELGAGLELRCAVKLRYRQADQACSVRIATHDRLEVRFERHQRAVAPGQYAVFYAGERCLGGAVIASARAAEPGLERAS